MPHSTSAPRLGDLERVVMEHLWEAASTGGADFEGATVRQVHDRFEGEREIAYTTVMTVLDRLSKKSLVTSSTGRRPTRSPTSRRLSPRSRGERRMPRRRRPLDVAGCVAPSFRGSGPSTGGVPPTPRTCCTAATRIRVAAVQ